MKIIFVSNISWALYNFRRGLMKEIKDRGNEVIFCTTEDEYTVRLEQLGFRFIPIPLDRKGMNVFKDLILFLTLLNIYRKEKPDWILHNSTKPFLYGAVAAWLTGRRCINTHSGLGYLFIRMGLFTRFLLTFYKVAGICATKTFFQNKDDLELFLSKKLIDPEKCVLVPGSGVNIEYFRRKINIKKENGFAFLFMGRILWDKGVGELIEAVRTLRQDYPLMKINFLGMIDNGNPAGISGEQIETWNKEGLIEYLGEAIDVKPFLDDCDCVVLPSYREGIPRSLLEAAAMELPVIATDVPGCRAVVENNINGLLVKVRDPVDLARAMEKMINMPEPQRNEMGRLGRLKVSREFSEDLVIKAYCAEIGL
ncbi:MAG: glycosyltransferase family 4 protein [Candidatus Omnitrophica bacterium]|nr:glycosyltransferase family 4 protein [Candidatus Omnitrophota bacterium]